MAIFGTPIQQSVKNSDLSSGLVKDINDLKALINRVKEIGKNCKTENDNSKQRYNKMFEDMLGILDKILSGSFSLEEHFTIKNIEEVLHEGVKACLLEEERTKTDLYPIQVLVSVSNAYVAKNLSQLFKHENKNYVKSIIDSIVMFKSYIDISQKIDELYCRFQEMCMIPPDDLTLAVFGMK